MSGRDAAFMFAALLLVCGALLYLDWRRQGELELLLERLRALEGRLPAAGRERQPTLERILGADDDVTLADIARGNA